jgi:oligopeptidase A
MNPLLRLPFEIPFDAVETSHIVPAVRELVSESQKKIDEIANLGKSSENSLTYSAVVEALEESTVDLENAMGLVRHLEAVNNSPELRAAIETIEPELSAFYAAIPLNEGLWKALGKVENDGLAAIERRNLEKQIEAFERHGARLEVAAKERLLALEVELQGLCTKFSQNVLDATNAFELLVEEEGRLAGLPEHAKAAARAAAEAKGKTGYRFTLHAPSMQPALTYLDDAEIRRQLWEAYNHRAASGEFDNRGLMRQILTLRREKAHLLGFFNFADYVLADRMAVRGEVAREFLAELEKATRDKFLAEHRELEEFAGKKLEPWDVAYYAEKLRLARYDLDEEALRPYFEVDRTVQGMLRLFEGLLGIEVKEVAGAKVYDPAVKYYEIYSEGRLLGAFFADWFPRENKRGGAWMQALRTGGPKRDGSFEPHLGVICGNLTPPAAGQPALLTHREVETIFHEFGHLLHHCLSEVPARSLSGTSVPWDFVELPSQIMENWCWERESLDFFARHHETGEPIPEDLLERMRRARTFRAASGQMRQLGFGTVDLALHIEFDPNIERDLLDWANAVLQRFTPLPLPQDYAMILSFTHLFAAPVAYAAGYYSYKWAEVLEADAFSRFQQEGVLNAQTGREYRQKILSQGNSQEVRVLFRDFMGRDPNQNALLQRIGLIDGSDSQIV